MTTMTFIVLTWFIHSLRGWGFAIEWLALALVAWVISKSASQK